MKRNLFVIFLMSFIASYAQVGINTENPDPSSVLDINSDSKGVLLPRVTLANDTQVLTQNPNAIGLLVYHLGTPSLRQGFYSWNGTKWVHFIDQSKLDEVSYWAPQGTGTAVPKNNDNVAGATTEGDGKLSSPKAAVLVDIFQRGKVGIGYGSEVDVNFEDNPTLKQLEVGGDFRTSKFEPANNIFYGFETNSDALPENLSIRGNVLYSAKTNSLKDYSYPGRLYDGSMLIQSEDKMYYLARKGVENIGNGTSSFEVQNNADGMVSFIYGTNIGAVSYEFSKDYFKVNGRGNSNPEFGINFDLGKFYIGNIFGNTHYTFPSSKGTEGQVLALNSANDLTWVNNAGGTGMAPAQKFFYMPSIVINTKDVAQGQKRNLYLEYVAQFTNKEFVLDANGGSLGANPSATFVKSTNAPNAIPVLPNATDIYYYVTDYDQTALENLSIDENGILTYDVKAAGTDYSFLNIVFVVK